MTSRNLDKSMVTPDFLKSMDGKLVWIRDDYLSMAGICYTSDLALYEFLEHVAAVKEEVRATGYQFVA